MMIPEIETEIYKSPLIPLSEISAIYLKNLRNFFDYYLAIKREGVVV